MEKFDPRKNVSATNLHHSNKARKRRTNAFKNAPDPWTDISHVSPCNPTTFADFLEIIFMASIHDHKHVLSKLFTKWYAKTRNEPQWANMSHKKTKWATMIHNEPQWFSMSHTELQLGDTISHIALKWARLATSKRFQKNLRKKVSISKI